MCRYEFNYAEAIVSAHKRVCHTAIDTSPKWPRMDSWPSRELFKMFLSLKQAILGRIWRRFEAKTWLDRRSLYAVVSNGNLGAMTWKTDDTFVMASVSSLRKGFVKSECAEYKHKFGHFGRDRPDLLANIVRESKIEALQAKVFDIESKITHIDGFSDKLDGMLRSFHDK
ncbi:unnamed protein product [Prunus armeniaca]|uniref:Uncharacterized protein n=1 Tax=Prunus armeniaca TaxID=36596 RepID=A0A6J5TS04_PRUAR|nr:unnamed protein product [Prunus armeniaca]